MKSRTMSIGGATYDLFLRLGTEVTEAYGSDRAFTFPLGAKIRTEGVIETCGGGASNTSVGLARLGCTAGFCGVVGDDQWGEKLLKNLQRESVDTQCATVVEGEVSSFSLILSGPGGERVILYDPGTNDHLHDVTFDREHAATVDWVYLNHIQESTCVIQDDLIDMLAADSEPRLTWNPGGCQIETGLEAPNNTKLTSHTDLLLLNKEEALAFTKCATVDKAIKTLLDIGTKKVCVTDGKNGTWASDGKQLYHCPIIPNVTVVDTTGAGDAFGTAVTWALLDGRDLPTALRAGTINASSVVGAMGAQAGLLTHTEMLRRLEETHIALDTRTL
jgi:sugar/nucleoside kinase (ribokinase family)